MTPISQTPLPLITAKIIMVSQGSNSNQSTSGVHPFYLGLEPDGSAHGVFILNSNAQEYTTGPAPHLVYRTIGGQLELFYFPGPTPEEVIRQYEQVIGTPYLPAYWAFGFQVVLKLDKKPKNEAF